MQQEIKANGKLLLTGEYFVLDGAEALALPTVLGQKLCIEAQYTNKNLIWKSYEVDGKTLWFEGEYSLPDFQYIRSSEDGTGEALAQILQTARSLQINPEKNYATGITVTTYLDFEREWGLGTSSTLLYSIAQWFGVDAQTLSAKTLGGSGYDVACAGVSSPILYRREDGVPMWETAAFNPPFKEHLYFVYLELKQNSREAIKRYRQKVKASPQLIQQVSELTLQILNAQDIYTFDKLLKRHEYLVGSVLDFDRVKDAYFPDFWGEVKSLGAWGGDFVIATSESGLLKTQKYFADKGFPVCLKYEQLIF